MDSADMDWRALAEEGTCEELIRWGRDDHHVDLTDPEVVLPWAAIAVVEAVWRNNTELETIHVGGHKRRGQPKDGLSDEEMMLGSIETAKVVRRHLANMGRWWYFDLEEELCDFDRPYAGTPLSSHVTKTRLKAHQRQVRTNLWRYRLIDDLVGRDRFLLGLALSAMDNVFWGSPLWPSQVDAWAEDERTTPRPAPEVVEQMKVDPTALPLEAIGQAIDTGIGYAEGCRRWHSQQCGDPDHRPSSDLIGFLGIGHYLLGAPTTWAVALARRAQSANAESGAAQRS